MYEYILNEKFFIFRIMLTMINKKQFYKWTFAMY